MIGLLTRPTGLCAGLLLLAAASPSNGAAQTVEGYSPEECPPCASWNEPTDPVRIFGSTYWVGTRRLGAILIASDSGHVLIDGALPESAPLIEANIEALGFDMDDVRLILNTHAHYDHAGGVAALQRSSGARVAALGPSAETMEAGRPTPDDPQTRSALTYPSVPSVDRISDGNTLAVGPIRVTAHRTAGHTPGGTSWSWRACEGGRCLELVYADSQTPVSDDGFRFSNGPYTSAVDDFQTGQETLRSLTCDILITPHPGASGFWERWGDGGLEDRTACSAYADTAAAQLRERLERESGVVPRGP